MKNFITGFLVPTKDAIRNDQGDIVIAYDDIELSAKPIVFVTASCNSGPLVHIPTVVRVGNTHITIKDENPQNQTDPDYCLNILLLDPSPYPFHNAMLYPITRPKTQVERISMDVNESPNVCFLTPFWDGGASVGSIETLNNETNENNGYQDTYANSLNYSSNYFINYLSVRPRYDYTLLSTGYITKSAEEVPVTLPNPWGQLPCIILTPIFRTTNAIAANIDYVKQGDQSKFTIASKNVDYNLNVNWLAVPQDVPRRTKNYALDGAFEHIYTHFPDYKLPIEQYRKEFENIILKGIDPSQELINNNFNFTPSIPPTRSSQTEEGIAIAKVCFDAISLLINTFTGIKLAFNQKAVNAINDALANPGEGSSLIPPLREAIDEIGAVYHEESVVTQNNKVIIIVENLKVIAKVMLGLGAIKSILVIIYEDFTMPTYKWVITIVTIAAQITAIVASDGLIALAWGARIIALLGSAETLVSDSIALYKLNHPSTT